MADKDYEQTIDVIKYSDMPMIKMSNKLAEAKYRLGISEQKLFMHAIELMDPNASEFNIITFNLKDYSKRSGASVKELYRDIKTIVSNLMETVLMIQDENDTQKWKSYNLTSMCEYDNGQIKIEFNHHMQPFMLGLKANYHTMLGDIPMQFKSWHSIRIYQYLKANAYRMTHTDGIQINYMQLRAMLGIKEDEYDRFDNFKSRVLEAAKKEINSKSDIRFDYTKITEKKKIVGLKFEVDVLPTPAQEESKIVEEIMGASKIREIKKQCGLGSVRLNSKQVMELYGLAVDTYGEDPYKYVKWCYEYMLAKVTPKKGIFNCLRDIVKHDRGSIVNQIKADIKIYEHGA